ncbi:MAG: alpha/beta hydrolase [Rhodobacteraceae bacterium]|nr:alpha/beta hydrolase [Paracoccaceae bacterium]MBR9819987.1 alpha/beta hydrolase [Paracoccaceae bacterium]
MAGGGAGIDSGIDWADAFDNMGHVPGAAEMLRQGAEDARAFREAASNASFDLAYGRGPRTLLDLFLPMGQPRGLAVFLHGGYWQRLSKDDWSHVAAGALARGWAMAIPSYTLAPQARISQMTREMAQAVTFAAARVPGPLRIAGHSAGGHLALRMACAGGPLDPAVAARLEHVVSISGLHDLRPLRLSPMNAVLGLDADEARAESPALAAPLPGVAVTVWVGGAERPEFLRQAGLMAEAWEGRAAALTRVIENRRNHFDVVEGLAAPASPLVEAFLG